MKKINKISMIFVLMLACSISVFAAENITIIEENAISNVKVNLNTEEQLYTDEKINIESLSFSEVSDYTYTGQSITPNVTIKHGEITLVKGKDYLLFYSKNKNVGTATIRVCGLGKYTGIKKVTFKINKASINNATINGLVTKEYTGENVTQTLKLKYKGITLKNEIDYTLTYKNNKEIGRAKVVITGKGNFSSNKILTFTITPQKTSIQDVTIIGKNIEIEWSKVSDVTGYIVYMSKDGGKYNKVGTISENSTLNYTIKNLEEGSYGFKVRSYKIVDKMGYYSDFSLEKTVVVKTQVTPVDTEKKYILGKDIDLGSYKVIPIDTSKKVIIMSGRLEQNDELNNETGESIVGCCELGNMYKGYVTITNEYENVIIVKNGILEKVDLEKIPVDIQTTVSNGMYIIGKDIEPGIYKVTPDNEVAEIECSAPYKYMKEYIQSGYIEITSDYEFVNILDGTLTKVSPEDIKVNIKSKVSNGIYVVGRDIVPGIYKISGNKETNLVYPWNIMLYNNSHLEDCGNFIAQRGYIEIAEDIYAINLLDVTIEKIDQIPTNIQTTVSEDGVYVVGKDIEKGVYKYYVKDNLNPQRNVEKLADLKMKYASATAWSTESYGYFEVTDKDYAVKLENVKIEKVDLENLPVNIKTTLPKGAYVVGKDIEPGVYKITKGNDNYANAIRVDESHLNMERNYLGRVYINNSYIQVLDTDKFVIVNSGTLEKIDLEKLPVNIKTTMSEDGTYIVGKDIEPGVYKLTCDVDSAGATLINSLEHSPESNIEYAHGKRGITRYIEVKENTYAVDIFNFKMEKIDMENTSNIQTTISKPSVYIVGVDIAPGIYKMENAHVTRHLTINVDSEDCIESKYYDYGYMEIKDTDVSVFLREGKITKVDIDTIPVDYKTNLSCGLYIVGKDIEAGTYKITEVNSKYADRGEVNVYTSFDVDDLTNFFKGNYGYIEIDPTEYMVEVGENTILTKVEIEKLPVKNEKIVSGTGKYIVGKDIAPGIYKAVTLKGYSSTVTRLSSIFGMGFIEMININPEKVIEIKDTDYAIEINNVELTYLYTLHY